MEEVTIVIDGREVKAVKGESVYEVAKREGIEIPTLCYHPALTPFGACRLCSVEVTDKRGRKRIVTACNYPVEDGLKVDTRGERVIRTRRMILELLLARCPKVKKIQDLAREYGIEKPSLWVEREDEDCILCGLCARVCEELIGVSAINFANRGTEREITTPFHSLSDDCIGCGACATICPTGAIKYEKNIYPTLDEDIEEIERRFLSGHRDDDIGVYNDIFSAKTPIEGQDGGVVTALLVSGLEKGLFEGAIVVQREDGYKAKAVIAESVEDIMKARGTKYLRVKMMSKLGEAIERGMKKIAIVGTPCEVRAARKIQRVMMEEGKDVEITIIGLFCFESFVYEKLKEETRRRFGVDIDAVKKTQISKGKYIVEVDGKEYSCRVKELSDAVESGCAYCKDFVSLLADVSVGSVGSPDGYSTVIVRSEAGKRLVDAANLVKEQVNKEEIAKLASMKRKNAEKKFEVILSGIRG
ncbi:MAG: Coenzyme F420 hydrogenase/dehydrogenase, beta subunit C-terminal domain [Candidatus Methanospirareceae archaeon]